MASSITLITTLPNEVLINILSTFSTRDLLPITSTSHRIHDIILRILHHRLLSAASLKEHKLILECYLPFAKLSTPSLFCEYLGTDGLDSFTKGAGDLYSNVGTLGRLGKLSGLYSRFQPIQPENEGRVRRHPAGGLIRSLIPDRPKGEFVCQNIDLESHELFSQLCTTANLVKMGPKMGLFFSSVQIGPRQGLMRVFRSWLKERAGNYGVMDREEEEKRLLWADTGRNVGLKMRVTQMSDIPAPVVVRRDEDEPVSYTLQYEELVVRTTKLLLMLEQSIEDEVNHSGHLCNIDGIYPSAVATSPVSPNAFKDDWFPFFGGGIYGL